jgi:site-specific recombinase XerD
MNIGKYVGMYSEDLKLKNYAPNTILNYSNQVKLFLEYFNKVATKPSEISEKQIKEWLLLSKSINGRKHRISAVKLFYKYTGKQPLKFKHIEYPRAEKKLPKIIEKEFLLKQLDKITNSKHKALLTMTYSTGMRVSEVINLLISDIDSKRMIIFIRNSKGNKDRIVPLSQKVLELLRVYFKEYNPKEYLFNGQFSNQYSDTSCNQLVKKYIGAEYHMHLLRHSNATALLEAGTDLRYIQKHLGHSNVKTTEVYCHVSTAMLSKLNLPV